MGDVMTGYSKTPFYIGDDGWFVDCPFIPIMCGDTKIAEVLPKDGEGLSTEDRLKASFIVNAMNCHAGLVEALARCEAMVSTDQGPPNWDWIRSVLKKARGETP